MLSDEATQNRIFIKQFGLQRSGTNVMKALLEINYPNVRVLTTFLGNKHSASTWESIASMSINQDYSEFDLSDIEVARISDSIKKQNLPIIIHVKMPIPWFESYFRYQKKKIQFTNPDSNPIFDFDWCKKCANLWENRIASWLMLANEFPDNCLIIKHMETIENPEKLLAKIVNKFGLDGADELVTQIDNVMKRGHYKEHGRDLINPYHKFDSSYHTEKKWLDNYPPEVLAFAEKEVSKIVERNEIISQSGIDFTEY